MAPAPIYLIEGPDGVGKTTLADELIEDLEEDAGYDVVFIHNTSDDANLPGSLYHHYLAQILDAAERATRGVATVIDRSFLSETIYGEYYRNHPRVSRSQARRLERIARRKGVSLLAVWAPMDDRRTRILHRGEVWSHLDVYIGAAYSVWFQARARYWTPVERSSALSK